ncbi:MAG: FkbM family methyltransferase, partial [Vicinamibacterales bacterium]
MIGRLSRALVHEVKRGLCLREMGEYTFRVSRFGAYRFICGNRVEFHRTVEYGNEAAALGAFLFLLRPDDVVWDIGASVGLYSIHAAGVAKAVVAIEPDQATFTRLRQNIELNSLANRISCSTEALGETAGEGQLRTDGLGGNAPALADLGRHADVTSVKVTTIDHLLESGSQVPTVL